MKRNGKATILALNIRIYDWRPITFLSFKEMNGLCYAMCYYSRHHHFMYLKHAQISVLVYNFLRTKFNNGTILFK